MDSSCFNLICKADFKKGLSCRQKPKSLKRVGERKNVSLMKKLNFEQMEGIEGGMSCGVALALYGAAFIGAALATGGAAIVFSLVGLGGSIWSAIDSCKYQLQ